MKAVADGEVGSHTSYQAVTYDPITRRAIALSLQKTETKPSPGPQHPSTTPRASVCATLHASIPSRKKTCQSLPCSTQLRKWKVNPGDKRTCSRCKTWCTAGCYRLVRCSQATKELGASGSDWVKGNVLMCTHQDRLRARQDHRICCRPGRYNRQRGAQIGAKGARVRAQLHDFQSAHLGIDKIFSTSSIRRLLCYSSIYRTSRHLCQDLAFSGRFYCLVRLVPHSCAHCAATCC